MRKLKKRDERKRTLDTRIYPVVRIASGNQISSMNTITVTLIPLSTKELAHKGRGSPRPPYKVVVAAPHQAGGSMTLSSHQDSKGPAHRVQEVVLS